MNRGDAYTDRIRGERADNLETAIAGDDAALEVLTREAIPVEWAQTQHEPRARLCRAHPGGSRRQLETAIAGYDAALEVLTREAMPVDWARPR